MYRAPSPLLRTAAKQARGRAHGLISSSFRGMLTLVWWSGIVNLPFRGQTRSICTDGLTHHGYRYPPQVIRHVVWPYDCFKLLTGAGGASPRELIPDKLASDSAPPRSTMPTAPHLTARRDNHRAENSRQPTCARELRMRGFKSLGSA